MSLTDNSIVSRSSNAIARGVSKDEMVILDLNAGVYYQVNGIGTAAWALLDMRPRTIEEITHAIVEKHNVETEDCRRDILAFVDEMAAAGLVEVSDGDVR